MGLLNLLNGDLLAKVIDQLVSGMILQVGTKTDRVAFTILVEFYFSICAICAVVEAVFLVQASSGSSFAHDSVFHVDTTKKYQRRYSTYKGADYFFMIET